MKNIVSRLGQMLGLSVVLALIAAVLNLTFIAPAQADTDSNDTTSSVSKADDSSKTQSKKNKTKKNIKCKKTPKPFVKDGVTVFSMKTCFNIKILKKMGCDTEAGKDEPVAPPRDPRSECKGWLKVDFKLKMKSPKTPEGMMCTEFDMSITIKQRMKAHGLSVSIANGNVDTWARTHLKLKDVIKGWIKTNCVLIPPPPPPPPTVTPTYSCDTLAVNKGAGRSVTIGNFSTSQSGGATFKEAVIEWGDGSSNTYAAPVGKSHTYGADGTYTITATAVFDVNGVEKRVSSSGCQSAVTFIPAPEKPLVWIVAPPAHIECGGHVEFFVKAKNATKVTAMASPDWLGWVSGFRKVDTEQNGVTPCESGFTCWQGTVWTHAGQTGTLTVGVEAEGPGGTDDDSVDIPVPPANDPDV